MTKFGWLIERHQNGTLLYWTGRFVDTSRGFSADANEAVRFARQQDAAAVLAWLLDGNGSAAEHGFDDGATDE